MKICRVSEMRDMDQRAISEYGITQDLLMENAGEATYFTILNNLGVLDNNFLVFCGIGNNGGDGLVVARKLHSNGGKIKLYLMGDAAKFNGSAKLNYEICKKLELNIIQFGDISQVQKDLHRSNIIIDALFGTGLDREVEGKFKEVIDLINDSNKPVVSVDIPSGINGNNGYVMGCAIEADYTITFGLPKLGNICYPGYDYAGNLFVTHISFPPEMHNDDLLKIEVNHPEKLPARSADFHKGSCGKVLFICGSEQYLGAPVFSAQSFLKSGGGLSYLATVKTIAPQIAARGSEIVLVPQEVTDTGSIEYKNKSKLVQKSEECDLVIIGPGLSLNDETQKLTRELIQEIEKPVLIDGDGLTAISIDPSILKNRTAPTVLTPHPGEMARLLGSTIAEIDQNKTEILQEKSAEWKTIIVLKGAHSKIVMPNGRVYINLSGNPGMATAGSGDVLTGTIAGMYGIGLNFEDAIRMGVFIHGFAGDLAASDIGEDGIIASDIMNYIPEALINLRNDFDNVVSDCYSKIYVV